MEATRDADRRAVLVAPDSHSHILWQARGRSGPNLTARIRENGSGRIHLAGWRPDTEVLAAGTALILPSLWEGLPNVVLEAMAAVAVVATRGKRTSELVITGTQGCWFRRNRRQIWRLPSKNID